MTHTHKGIHLYLVKSPQPQAQPVPSAAPENAVRDMSVGAGLASMLVTLAVVGVSCALMLWPMTLIEEHGETVALGAAAIGSCLGTYLLLGLLRK